ncbi:MAG: TetR/AcrR family transcriptional regulator [Chloroflexi bacterium]|nr:TetR/AcrR family transcriptional regulator [Chloroflexota bacterium]
MNVKVQRRQAIAADATRHTIVEAAHTLFVERGYVATTINDIASASGVAVQTVYNSVGPKRAVLAAILDHVAAGPETPTPVPVFMRRRVAATRTGRGAVRVLAAWFAEVHGRLGPMLHVMRDAAAIDPEVAQVERVRDVRRFHNYHEAARIIAERGDLRANLRLEDAAAVIWSLGNAEIYRFLVLQQAWTPDHYRRWLERGLRDELLRR